MISLEHTVINTL